MGRASKNPALKEAHDLRGPPYKGAILKRAVLKTEQPREAAALQQDNLGRACL